MRSFKYVFFFLSALVVLATSCHEKAVPDTPEKLFGHYRKSVVLIRNQFYIKVTLGDGRTGYLCGIDGGVTADENEARRAPLTAYGTGFFVSEDGKIATNRHVVFPDSEGKDMAEDMKYAIANAVAASSSQADALTDSITEISNYIEEHADQLSTEELDQLNAQKEALQERIEAEDTGFDEETAGGMKIAAVPVSIGVAYDNTSLGNNDSYHPCIVLDKSGTEDIDLAIIQLADKKVPDNVDAVFSFEDHNPNVKNGTSEKDEAYDINKQLSIDKRLYMIGYNYGEEMANTTNGLKAQFTQGTVSQESDEYKVLYSIPALPGSSGSPVIDQWGNLVAINYAGVKNSQSFNYGILAKHLKNMLMNVNSESRSRKTPAAAAAAGVDFEQKIRAFVAAEASRNFDAIYQCLAPNMRRYWDLNNPTREQLRARYEHSWDITANGRNEIQKIRQVDGYTYDLYAVYSYTNRKGESKQLKTVIRFEFDGYGKIVETYGR